MIKPFSIMKKWTGTGKCVSAQDKAPTITKMQRLLCKMPRNGIKNQAETCKTILVRDPTEISPNWQIRCADLHFKQIANFTVEDKRKTKEENIQKNNKKNLG